MFSVLVLLRVEVLAYVLIGSSVVSLIVNLLRDLSENQYISAPDLYEPPGVPASPVRCEVRCTLGASLRP